MPCRVIERAQQRQRRATDMKHPVLDRPPRLHPQPDHIGLEFLSAEWRGQDEPHIFRCAAGHELRFTASAIERKTQGSCPSCQAALGLQRLRQAAAARGGQCLSEAGARQGTCRLRHAAIG